MKGKTKIFEIAVTLAGLALLCAGLLLIKAGTASSALTALPYIFVGLGCGAFGHGIGGLIERRVMEKHPAHAKQMEIERADERSVALTNRAKAKAYDAMIFIFGALMVALALMGVEMTTVLLLVFAYLCVVSCNIYYRVRLEKEM